MSVNLSVLDLSISAGLVLILAGLSFQLTLSFTGTLIVAAIRTAIQLSLVGLILEKIFHASHWIWLVLIGLVMLVVAGYEVKARQQRRLRGVWGYAVGSLAMFVTVLPLTAFSLIIVIGPTPWYKPQYLIPLLGMLLGNAMSSVAIGMDSLLKTAWQQKHLIEARLLLGQNKDQAIEPIFRASTHSAMIPIINAMAAAGVISLPGMMTGQLLAGASPMQAVNYQIVIMFLIASVSGFATLLALSLLKQRLFDKRHRLRLDRLQQ